MIFCIEELTPRILRQREPYAKLWQVWDPEDPEIQLKFSVADTISLILQNSAAVALMDKERR